MQKNDVFDIHDKFLCNQQEENKSRIKIRFSRIIKIKMKKKIKIAEWDPTGYW